MEIHKLFFISFPLIIDGFVYVLIAQNFRFLFQLCGAKENDKICQKMCVGWKENVKSVQNSSPFHEFDPSKWQKNSKNMYSICPFDTFVQQMRWHKWLRINNIPMDLERRVFIFVENLSRRESRENFCRKMTRRNRRHTSCNTISASCRPVEEIVFDKTGKLHEKIQFCEHL